METDGIWILAIVLLFVLLFLLAYARAPEEPPKKSAPPKRAEPEDPLRYYKIGKQFEDYVKGMFPPDRFELLHQTIGAADLNGGCTPDCVYPDFQFKDRATRKEFWVECKYRSHRVNGNIDWADQKHLDRYIRIGKETCCKVYIIVGVGGDPSCPNEVFLFDLDDTHFTQIYRSRQECSRVRRRVFGSLSEIEMLCARRRSQG